MADEVYVGVAVLVIDKVIDGKTVHAGAEFPGVFADAFEHAFDLAEIKGKKRGDAAGLAEIKTFKDDAFGLGDHRKLDPSLSLGINSHNNLRSLCSVNCVFI